MKRQTSGSVVCPTCGRLVAVQEPDCPHCGRKFPGMFGFSRILQGLSLETAFVQLIMIGCGVLYVLTLITNPAGVRMNGMLSMLAPSTESLFLFGASGAVPLFGYDRWWTVLSASWLHGGLLHILFNMMWVRQLAPATSRLYGPGRMMLIYLGAGVAGFLLSSFMGAYFGFLPPPLQGARFTIGASASIFGLLGALVLYGRRSGSTALGRQVWTWALVLFVFGFLMPGVDNFAHLGGFGGGYALAKWMDPMREERLDHLVGALIGLGLTFVAIIASVVLGQAFLG